jgi:hypothetical protein
VPHPSTATPAVNGLWRILIHDPEPADPKWLLATVAGPADVRPASPGETAPDQVTTQWVADCHGQPVTLTRLPRASVWRVDTGSR